VFKLVFPVYGTDTEKQYPRSDLIDLENNVVIVIVVRVVIGVIFIRLVLFLASSLIAVRGAGQLLG
jgi:hypothetical protein